MLGKPIVVLSHVICGLLQFTLSKRERRKVQPWLGTGKVLPQLYSGYVQSN